jgi:uncharacterized pyridoxamine 5'-phosphate oxidase family protein
MLRRERIGEVTSPAAEIPSIRFEGRSLTVRPCSCSILGRREEEVDMAETITALQQEALSWLKDTATTYMATVERDQPRTRPISILWREGCVWLTSGTSNGKTQQVRRNPNVELCVPIERDGRHGYVRLAGTADIVTDPQTRARIAAELPFFNTFWDGPDDPRYTLIRVLPSEVLYLRPEEDHHHTIYL